MQLVNKEDKVLFRQACKEFNKESAKDYLEKVRALTIKNKDLLTGDFLTEEECVKHAKAIIYLKGIGELDNIIAEMDRKLDIN